MSKNKNRKDEKRSTVFQAVVLCEDFGVEYYPLNLKTPRCLLPVANRPMLAYVLDHLIFNCKLQEIFLVYSNFGQQIQEFVKENYKVGNICKFEFKGSTDFRCLGDVFRQFDDEELIKDNPFVLCAANCITNVNIKRIYDAHRKQLETEANTTLTMVLSPAPAEDERRYFIAHDENRCILSFRPPELAKNPIDVEAGIFKAKKRSRVNFRMNLRDTGIAICSPSVPSIFNDAANSDVATLDDFVKQSLDDSHMGVANNDIFFSVIPSGEFGDMVTSFAKQEEITKAIFNRLVSPFTPSYKFRAKLLNPYSVKKKENYRGQNVKCAPNALVDRRSIVGHNVEIGSGSYITNSCIGDNCRIGENVKICDSTICDASTICDGSKVTRSIVGPNCVLDVNSVLAEMSVVGEGVHLAVTDELGPIVVSDIKNRLNNSQDDDEYDEDDFDDEDFGTIGVDIAPKHIQGESLFLWKSHFDKDAIQLVVREDYEKSAQELWNRTTLDEDVDDDDSLASSDDQQSSSENEDDLELEDDEFDEEERQRRREERKAKQNLDNFTSEAAVSVRRCWTEKLSSVDICAELSGSKNAYEVDFTQIIAAVATEMIEIASPEAIFDIDLFKQVAKHFKDMLVNYLNPDENPNVKMQFEFLATINSMISSIGKHAQTVLTTCYGLDVLEGAIILHWFDKKNPDKSFKAHVSKFLAYLEEDSDEEESD